MIDILLAAYNGEKYIGSQIESILNQTYTDFKLIIRDDMSNDRTVQIIKEYQESNPDKITLISAEANSGSPTRNFFELIKLSNAPYIMLADQDDIWMQRKVEKTFSAIKLLEKQYGEQLPLMVHSDLMVVDDEMKVICDSMFKMQKMDIYGNEMNYYLVQNNVSGCTAMFNRTTLDYLNYMPANAIMHDWWLALIVSAFGHIGIIEEALIKYRQHQDNVEGAKEYRKFSTNFRMALMGKSIKQSLKKTYLQAEEFEQVFGNKLNKEKSEMLHEYVNMEKKSKFNKYKTINKYDLKKTGALKRLGQYLYM